MFEELEDLGEKFARQISDATRFMASEQFPTKRWNDETQSFYITLQTEKFLIPNSYYRSVKNGYYYHRSKMRTTQDGPVGEDEEVYWCENCGVVFIEEDSLTYHDYYRAPVCETCISIVNYCDDCGLYYVNACECDSLPRYHHSKIRKCWPRPKKGDWGMEIELDSEQISEIKDIIRKYEWAIEADNSLDEYGVEIISPPMSYDELMDCVQDIVPKIKMVATSGHDGYGIHISFNAAGMSRLNLAKYIEFMTTNPCGLCEIVGGRMENRYSRYVSKKMFQEGRIRNGALNDVLQGDSKYDAVNVCKLPRVETRIFKSSLDVDTVKANLQFVRAVKDMCGCYHFENKATVSYRSSATDGITMAKEFMGYIKKFPKGFKELKRVLAQNSYQNWYIREMVPKNWKKHEDNKRK